MNDEEAKRHQEISRSGGQATSWKKKRAARRNAKKPRPGRKAFNAAVRACVAAWKGGAPTFQSEGREFISQFTNDIDRARKIYHAAFTRLKV